MVQMEAQSFIGKYSVYVGNVSTRCKRLYDSSRIYESFGVYLFRELTSGPAVAAIKKQLKLSSIEANRHESTITAYSGVVNHRVGL